MPLMLLFKISGSTSPHLLLTDKPMPLVRLKVRHLDRDEEKPISSLCDSVLQIGILAGGEGESFVKASHLLQHAPAVGDAIGAAGWALHPAYVLPGAHAIVVAADPAFVAGEEVVGQYLWWGLQITSNPRHLRIVPVALGQAGEEVWWHQAVVVGEGHDFACGSLNTSVTSRRRTSVRLLAEIAHLGELPPNHLLGAVGGAVVYNDDLVVGVVLARGGSQAAAQQILTIMSGND
jgi:hypothetical protein